MYTCEIAFCILLYTLFPSPLRFLLLAIWLFAHLSIPFRKESKILVKEKQRVLCAIWVLPPSLWWSTMIWPILLWNPVGGLFLSSMRNHLPMLAELKGERRGARIPLLNHLPTKRFECGILWAAPHPSPSPPHQGTMAWHTQSCLIYPRSARPPHGKECRSGLGSLKVEDEIYHQHASSPVNCPARCFSNLIKIIMPSFSPSSLAPFHTYPIYGVTSQIEKGKENRVHSTQKQCQEHSPGIGHASALRNF